MKSVRKKMIPHAHASGRHVAIDRAELTGLFASEFDEHTVVLGHSREVLSAGFCALVEACAGGLASGGKLLLFGNGGSAADAQHIATELTVRYARKRDAFAALALTTDTSTLTAAGNDLGFEHVFSRQIEALGRPGDVALGLSTSGRSPNVVTALRTARERGLVTAALSGGNGGDLPALTDVCVIVPSTSTARIQEMHMLIGHALCGALETLLGRSE